MKNIAVFLIFSAFAEIIIPNEKYKVFLKSIIGFFIIIIVLNPVFNIFNKDNTNIFDYVGNEFNKTIIEKEGNFYDKKQKEVIQKNFLENLNRQAVKILENVCIVHNVEFYLEKDSFNIERIELAVEENDEKSFFRIEKFKTQEEKESEFNNNVKKIISDFYNLPYDNIYIRKQ